MTSTMRLADVRDCLEGVLPAVIATCSADGIPNVTYLSKVRYVDEEHVALSNQFFSKTTENIGQNPRAQITLLRPSTGQQVRLDVFFVRREDAGELFEQLRAELDAIASLMGMQDVFRLRSADVYRVARCELVASDVDGDHDQRR
jgi:adenylate cyclase